MLCHRLRPPVSRPPDHTPHLPRILTPPLSEPRRCHFTLGNSVADAYKSLELARTAWTIATGAAGGPALAGSCRPLAGRLRTVHQGLYVCASSSTDLRKETTCIVAGGEEAEGTDPNLPWGRGVLKPGGSLVMKLLQGSGERRGGAWRGWVLGGSGDGMW